MALGKRKKRDAEFWVATQDIARAPGHVFYDKLNKLLAVHGFDAYCEKLCQKFYAEVMGRPSIPPGVYFRLLLIGFFEGVDSERGIAWRCADSLSLRTFLGYELTQPTPDHTTISRTRRLIDLETHRELFIWILKVLAEYGLVKGNTLGIDASTMEANAALRTIVRKDTRETYTEFLEALAKASGIETPTREQLIAFDRKRKDKTMSNDDWQNPYDPDAKIAKMKDGCTHLAHKNEHAVDLETGAVIAAEIHPADQGDTTTLGETLGQACATLTELKKDDVIGEKVMTRATMEAVVDKGYHSNETLVEQQALGVRTYFAEPDRRKRNWRNTTPPAGATIAQTRDAVYGNRRRMKGRRGKALHRKRGELVERAFAHVLDTGGMRRAWLKGRENLHKRYLVHVGGFNLSLIMRKLVGCGTPREWAGSVLTILRGWIATCIDFTRYWRPIRYVRAA